MRAHERFYLLKGKDVEEVDQFTWAAWFEHAEDGRDCNTLAYDEFGCKGGVSTIFIGINHFFSEEPKHDPLLFETMVFGGLLDRWCKHYATRDEAMTGHIEMCNRVMGQSWLKSLLRRWRVFLNKLL